MDQPDDLRLRRCLHHPGREAVARCPGCARHFCRECVGEHGGRWLCATCLAASGPAAGEKPSRLAFVLRLARAAAGLAAAWFFFYLVGQGLLHFTDPIHPAGDRPAASGDPPAAGTP